MYKAWARRNGYRMFISVYILWKHLWIDFLSFKFQLLSSLEIVVVVFVLNIPPATKVIWRLGNGLKSHPTDWWSRGSNLRPLVYKASGLSTTPQGLLSLETTVRLYLKSKLHHIHFLLFIGDWWTFLAHFRIQRWLETIKAYPYI